MLFNIELQAKKKGLSQEKLDKAMSEQNDRLMDEMEKGSTGTFGKCYERYVRHPLLKRGIQSEDDFRARPNCTIIPDVMIKIHNVWTRIEIKTGDGIIGWTDKERIEEEDILHSFGYIVYCAEPTKLNSMDDVLDKSIVLTREEFFRFLAENGPKRKNSTWKTGVKLGVNSKALREANKHRDEGEPVKHDCIVLHPSYRMARWMACKSGRYTSLRKFLKVIDRGA